MHDDERDDLAEARAAADDPGRYEPPELSIYEDGALVAWASDKAGTSPPDDTLGDAPRSGEAPEVLGWSAPSPEYANQEPKLFVAPKDPDRRTSPPKKVFKETDKPGKTTRTHATRTKLTGHDAFGGVLCTCDLVCTCNLVCTCQAVAACACVAHTEPGGEAPPPCACDAQCSCVADACSTDFCGADF